jgi:hypothetical protein
MKPSKKIDCDKIDKIHRKEVELVIAKINELLDLDVAKENYEDCARLKDIVTKFEAFLKNVFYNEIKDDLEFANSKITEHFKDAMSKAKNKGKN